jgi:signal peptidase II
VIAVPGDNARIWGAAFAGAAFTLDQTTKGIALASRETLAAGVDVLPFMSFVLVRNTGVSFGLFASGPGQWPLIFLTAAIIVGLSVWLIRTRQTRQAAAIGAIIGAALGNLADRLRHGGVTDFLDFHYGSHHWPAFNLADSVIFLGAVALVLTAAPQVPAQPS